MTGGYNDAIATDLQNLLDEILSCYMADKPASRKYKKTYTGWSIQDKDSCSSAYVGRGFTEANIIESITGNSKIMKTIRTIPDVLFWVIFILQRLLFRLCMLFVITRMLI